MNLKDYWSKPHAEQGTVLEGVYPPTRSCVRVIQECLEGTHEPADPNVKDTYCLVCRVPLTMIPILEKE